MLPYAALCSAVDICNDAWQGLEPLLGELVNGLLPPPHPLRARKSILFCPKQMPPVSRLQRVASSSSKAHLSAVQGSRAVRYTAKISLLTAFQRGGRLQYGTKRKLQVLCLCARCSSTAGSVLETSANTQMLPVACLCILKLAPLSCRVH